MSLIGDALRKKQIEGGDAKPSSPPIATIPAAPPPAPATEQPRLSIRGRSTAASEEPAPVVEVKNPKKSKPKHRAWVELLMVIAGVIVLAIAAILLFFYFRPAATEIADTKTAAPAQPPPASSTAEATVPKRPIATTKDVLADVQQNTSDADEIIGTDAPETAGATDVQSSNLPDAPAAESQNSESESSVAASTPAPVIEPIIEAALPVVWPPFSLQAAMGGGQRGSVLIDGKIVKVGDTYRDITIREITPDGVIMEYQGETKTFRVRR